MKNSLCKRTLVSGIVGLALSSLFGEVDAQTATIDLKKNQRKTLEELDRSVGVGGLRDGWNPTLAERKLKPQEQALLAPDAEVAQHYAEFLKQANTGLFRLLNMDRVVVTADQLGARPLYGRYRGGGSYYSFIQRRHDVDNWAQIKQQNHEFRAGIAQVDWYVSSEDAVSFKRSKVYGQSLSLFLLLGDVLLDAITAKRDDVQEMASFAIPTDRKRFHRKIQLSDAGFKAGKYIFTATAPIKANATYLLRSVIFSKADMVIAFRVVREDADGTLHILWKEIMCEGTSPIRTSLK